MHRSLALSIASLIMFLALAEGAVRLLKPDITLPADPRRFRFDQRNQVALPYHVRDNELGWLLKPSQAVEWEMNGKITGVMRTNSRGFRGAEFTDDKPPGVFRLVFAGDSNTLGYPLGEDAPYPAQTAVMLRRFFENDARPFESINLAVDGFSSFQIRRLLKRCLSRLRPDAVCVQAGFNDHCLSSVSDKEHPFWRPGILNVFEASHAYRWLRRHLLRLVRAERRGFTPVQRVSLDDYEANLRGIVRDCCKAGAMTILVTTALRSSTPLAVNEVLIDAGGEREWTTQGYWFEQRLAGAGFDPVRDTGSREYLRLLRTLVDEHPTWPLLHHRLALELEAQGLAELAAEARRTWRSLDHERRLLAEYMNRLRKVSLEENVEVIDAVSLLETYPTSPSEPSDTDPFFADFLHPNERGHGIIASQIAMTVANHLLQKRGSPSD